MYHTVIVKSFIFTEEIYYRVGIYAEAEFATRAKRVLDEAYPNCHCVIVQKATPERAKAEYPKELPAAALIPFAFQCLECLTLRPYSNAG